MSHLFGKLEAGDITFEYARLDTTTYLEQLCSKSGGEEF